MIEYKSYSSGEEIKVDMDKPSLPINVKSISVTYDGGRLSIFVNDKEVYENMGAGNDFNVEIV